MRMNLMQLRVPSGADRWREYMGDRERRFFESLPIDIDGELEHFSEAAIPLRWFGKDNFDRLCFAAKTDRL